MTSSKRAAHKQQRPSKGVAQKHQQAAIDVAAGDRKVGMEPGYAEIILVARLPALANSGEPANWHSILKRNIDAEGLGGIMLSTVPSFCSALPEFDGAAISVGISSFTLMLSTITRCARMLETLASDMDARGRYALCQRLSYIHGMRADFYQIAIQRGVSLRYMNFVWLKPGADYATSVLKVLAQSGDPRPELRMEKHEGFVRLGDAYTRNDMLWRDFRPTFPLPGTRNSKRVTLPTLDAEHRPLIEITINSAPLGLSVACEYAMLMGEPDRAIDMLITSFLVLRVKPCRRLVRVKAIDKATYAAVMIYIQRKTDEIAKGVARQVSQKGKKGGAPVPMPAWVLPEDRDEARSITVDEPFPIFFESDLREGLFCMRRTKDRKMLLKIMVLVKNNKP
ncbi:hypothetical protein QKT49_gp081 [Acanthamoeba castellanii medusavirus]|uniref:Uncharacterized protein n=1 Tax=Acanthamoeba castellanii medusavirus J1 TaxID=3114988 RepID=A0A3T1CWL8_9VIRU|nr:hypothetical protein QKT49_gp081 [Acanthamoeba castellanii medusavirus]BBI30221.1 hypothetical protein [Acanthamoeba castellanii medusavirus J1]